MASDVTIREATLADAEELRRFMTELFAEGLEQIFHHEPPTLEQEVELIEKLDRHERSVLLVATCGDDQPDEIRGVLHFSGHAHEQQAHAGNFGLVVGKAHRDAGIGSRLLDAIATWAAEHGIRRLELGVFSNNPAALRLYERKGYVQEGRQKDAVAVGDGYVDMIEMARFI